jgi:hypothetical protein
VLSAKSVHSIIFSGTIISTLWSESHPQQCGLSKASGILSRLGSYQCWATLSFAKKQPAGKGGLGVWNSDQWFSENQKNHVRPETTVLMKSKNQSRNVPWTASSLPSLNLQALWNFAKETRNWQLFHSEPFFFPKPKTRGSLIFENFQKPRTGGYKKIKEQPNNGSYLVLLQTWIGSSTHLYSCHG